LWGGIAGWLKARLSVNEILSTVMLNQIAAQIYIFLSADPSSIRSLLTAWAPQTAVMRKQSGWALPRHEAAQGLKSRSMALVFLWRTTIGYRMRAVGAGPEAARYGGIRVEFYWFSLAPAGTSAVHGPVEVLSSPPALGVLGYKRQWRPVRRLHPWALFPCYVGLILGADMMQRAVNIPAAIVMAVQGVSSFLVSSDIF
jgi:simple sugar transport system permease protein